MSFEPSSRRLTALHLVAAPDVEAVQDTDELPRCKGCNTPMRPQGATAAQYPGTCPIWADNQCRVCDYESCGKDPADRFIPVKRISYLASLRVGIETERRNRRVPAKGSRAGRIPLTDFLAQIS